MSLTYKDAHSISDNDLDHNWFTEFTNIIYRLHNHELKNLKSRRKELPDKYKNKFVQSPFTTRDEITTYTMGLTRNQHEKREIDRVPMHNASTDTSVQRSLSNLRSYINSITVNNVPTTPNYSTDSTTDIIVPSILSYDTDKSTESRLTTTPIDYSTYD